MCRYCKCNEMKESTTTHVVDNEGCLVIIRNVSCEECTQCGNKTFSKNMADRLEEIVKDTQTIVQEISVVDYRRIAYNQLKSYRKTSVQDMDYKAELLEALDEKFGCVE